MTLYAEHPMRVYLTDNIFIRTNLNTNFFTPDGAKSDVLDVIPVITGIPQIGAEHQHITRIYQAKERNMKNFTITLTDSDGNLLTFNSEYVLKLTFFFTDE